GGTRSARNVTPGQERTSMPPRAPGSRLRRRRRAPSRQRLELRMRGSLESAAFERGSCPLTPSGGDASGGESSARPSLISDARVEDAIQEVDDEVHDREKRAVG